MRLRRRSTPAGAAGASLGRINVTPLIDVIMVLIVFYLIVGKLAAERRSAMNLPPSVEGEAQAAPDAIFVNVTPAQAPAHGASAVYTVDREVVARSLLPGAIDRQLRRRPGATIHVRADRSLSYSAVSPVIEAASAAGAGGVRLATQREAGGGR